MPKTATKAAGNVYYIARCEAAKFNDHMASREGAAEELGIDRTRLARIELGSLTPYPEEVLLMADAYSAPQLSNQYCSTTCPLGRNTIPPCELLHIDRLTIKVLSALTSAGYIHDTMLEVAKDGQVTADEAPQLEEVMSKLDTIAKSALEMRIWIAKYIK